MTSKTFFKLSILSAFLFVASCSSIPSKKAEQDTYDRGTLLDTISKMDAIANVLGCALAPASEDCKKFKKEETPHQTQKEYNEQSSKEWEEFDKE